MNYFGPLKRIPKISLIRLRVQNTELQLRPVHQETLLIAFNPARGHCGVAALFSNPLPHRTPCSHY